MPPWETVHDHDGGELRGHGGAVPHAGAGRPVPGLAGPAGPHHLPLPAHAALLVVSIVPTGFTACASANAFCRVRPPGRRRVTSPTSQVPQLLAGFCLCFLCVCEGISLFYKISCFKPRILGSVETCMLGALHPTPGTCPPPIWLDTCLLAHFDMNFMNGFAKGGFLRWEGEIQRCSRSDLGKPPPSLL